jgi:hypothetical protein
VASQDFTPLAIAQSYGPFGRADEVGEKDRQQHPLTRPARHPRPEARPIDRKPRLVADHPAVVTRRDIEHLVRSDIHDGPISHLDMKPPRDHVAGVVGHAQRLAFHADLRAVHTRLEGVATDRRIGDLDDVRSHTVHLDVLVGRVEALLAQTHDPTILSTTWIAAWEAKAAEDGLERGSAYWPGGLGLDRRATGASSPRRERPTS